MSAALNALGDTSVMSAGTHPDLSLGSLASSFSERIRPVRTSSGTSSAPLGTPPASTGRPFSRKVTPADAGLPSFRRNASMLSMQREEDEGGVLNTPGAERERVWDAEPKTPVAASRAKSGGKSTAAGSKVPTLRDQEMRIEEVTRENFDLKLKLHYFETRLAELAPGEVQAALAQNINLKVEAQGRAREVKKLKKRAGELERALDAARAELAQRRAPADGGVEEDLRAAEDEIAALHADLAEAREAAQEHADDAARVRAELAAGADADASMARAADEARSLRARARELEAALADADRRIAAAEDARDDAADEADALRGELELSERRRAAEGMERSESRAAVAEAHDAREATEDALADARDRLAALTIELQEREDELAARERDVDALRAEHDVIVADVEEDWRAEMGELRDQAEDLKDALAKRDNECKDLQLQMEEYRAEAADLHARFEAALAGVEQQASEREEELAEANQEIKRLSEQMMLVEEEAERLRDEYERAEQDMRDELDRLDALNDGLKQKRIELEEQVRELRDVYDQSENDIHAHRQREEELAAHSEALAKELDEERDAREAAERGAAAAEHADALRRERRALEGKESALQSALADLARAEAELAQRAGDLQAVQAALRGREEDARRDGEAHTHAKFSLQLEVDRLQRDVARLEDDLGRARRERDERADALRARGADADRSDIETRDLATQLAAQTQARINIAEKLDAAQAAAKAAQAELAVAKARASELEQRLSKDQRALLSAETQFRDQVTERNTLLLTIYQYMEKIIGVDKVSKRGSSGETKPYTNFGVFHDNMLSRLKQVQQVQGDFDRRVKDAEARYAEKLSGLQKQLDQRWKQLDKFEASVKAISDAKATWRRKMSVKEGELDAVKAANSDLAAQLSSGRKPGGADPMELRSLQNRATNAERRLTIAQNQLAAAEEKLASVNDKTTSANTKWEARVKEYEDRLRKAEEQYKRERQGAKESQAAFETNIKTLTRQKELADKRNNQLQEMVGKYKVDAGATGSPAR